MSATEASMMCLLLVYIALLVAVFAVFSAQEDRKE